MRFLLLSCTERKTVLPEQLSAIDRYDGPAFRVVRKFLRNAPPNDMSVWIISAEHGLISSSTPIDDYDRVMTAERAETLHTQTIELLSQLMQAQKYASIFILLGKTYQKTIHPLNSWLPSDVKEVKIASGGAGQKLSRLKAWLYGEGDSNNGRRRTSSQSALFGELHNGRATLRGVELRQSPSEIEAFVKQAVENNSTEYARSRSWIAEVGPYRVAPKWLVSSLSGIPVSEFAADEARRVLRQLGIPVFELKGKQ